MKPDWMMSRLTVVLIAVLGPVYFFILMQFLPFQLAPFQDVTLDWWFHYVLVPSIFSAPWVGVIYNARYRLANTFHLTEETTDAVPLRWRVFYGTNAVFVLMFFILPIIAAPLAIIAGLFVAATVFYRIGVGKFGAGRPAAALAVIIAIALCTLPTLIMLEFIPRYIEVWNAVMGGWTGYWVEIVYGFAQCLVNSLTFGSNSLTFGSPFYFVFYAAQQYDRGLYGTVYTKTPTTKIRLGELILFVVFLYTYLPPIVTPFGTLSFLGQSWIFTQYINWISLSIAALMVLIRFRMGVQDNSTMGGPSNILVVGLFLIVEIFFKIQIVMTSIIWLAFLIFAAVSLVNFFRASPREMY
ncbi:MAG: hypothetical protein ACW960_11555 [Candidatus Thorarchaeota archaeon]